MSKELLSSEAVLERIGATSFRNISKDQLVAFVSAIPEMDKEIAIKCVEQFPAFKDYASTIVGQLQSMLTNVVTDNKTSRQAAVDGYMLILNSLKEKLALSDLSLAESNQIARDMIEVADKIAALDDKNKHFLEQLAKIGAAAASVAVAIGGGLLGVKFISKR